MQVASGAKAASLLGACVGGPPGHEAAVGGGWGGGCVEGEDGEVGDPRARSYVILCQQQ